MEELYSTSVLRDIKTVSLISHLCVCFYTIAFHPFYTKTLEADRWTDLKASRRRYKTFHGNPFREEDNRGVDFETAMSSIHGITPDGQVITGIQVFQRAYAAVGLG